MPLAGISSFTRGALDLSIAFIRSKENEIAMYCLRKSYSINEVMNVLYCAAFIYASNNPERFTSVTLLKGFKTLKAIPSSMRLAVLRGEVPSLQLFRQAHHI